jgi:flagellar hook assembly protein FlgD
MAATSHAHRIPCGGVVLRKLSILAVLAGAAALPAGASREISAQIVAQSLLMPGVTYQRQVEFTPHGPVVLDVVTAPKPDGTLYTLAPALSNGAIVGTQKLTDIEKRLSATTTSVGVNGDFFAANGTPSGILMRGGALDSAPAVGRSGVGITSAGTITVGSVAFDGTWRGTSQRRQLDLNDPPLAGHTTLYTAAWGATTPAESGVVEDVLGTFPPAQPNHVLTSVVTQVAGQGGTPIPPGGAVLVSRGAQEQYLTAEAPAGTTVEVRLTLTPDWSGMASAIGGGPLLVADGKAVFRANEAFDPSNLNARTARSAVGQLPDGRILLVSVEGGRPSYSSGMTAYELAVALVRLGAVTGMALGSGAPSSMAFDGALLTHPSSGTEAPISDALLLTYSGVYAAPPTTSVLSPNGDGVDDTQTFSYKILRPSQVSATLIGPAGSPVTLASDTEQPGVHTLTWNGTPAAEGKWTFTVTATDDQNHATIATRDFVVDNTLASLQVTPAVAALRPKSRGLLAATFQLVHPATVTATIETRAGVVIATLLNQNLQPGPQKVLWNGRTGTGALAFGGAYQVHVVAANSIGKVSLVAPFSAHRLVR